MSKNTKEKEKQSTVLVEFVTRGPKFVVEGQAHKKRVGAVVGVIDQQGVCKIGWSLCNYKQGDRFNAELAVHLAEGRARNQTSNSLFFKSKTGPTTQELMSRGIPQSCIQTIANIVNIAREDHSITSVELFCSRTPAKARKPAPLW